jgi:hypothetical protein
MLQSCRKSVFGRAAMGATVLLLGASLAPVGALAQDDPDDNALTRFEKRIWGGIVRGLGLQSPDDPVIEYRERSPLVVPPSRNLPPPQANAAAKRNPAWPTDPDVKRAKDRAEARRRMSAGNHNYEIDKGGTNLSPAELNPPAARTVTGSTAGGSPPPAQPHGATLQPSQLGYTGGLFSWMGFGFGQPKQEVGTFIAEPPRTDLTAPPAGYQTPSPAQPYGTTLPRPDTTVAPVREDTAVGRL